MNWVLILIGSFAISSGCCVGLIVHMRISAAKQKEEDVQKPKHRLMVFASKIWRLRGKKQYQQQARYALPTFMETLAMLLSAGFPLPTALQRIVSVPNSIASSPVNTQNQTQNDSKPSLKNNMQMNPLVLEFREVLRRTRTGESLSEALQKLRDTLPGPEIAMFVSLLIQANQHGGRLADLLNYQADVRRQQIAEEIEAQAQEAPVRLLMPLVIFIFPATMLPFIGVIIGKVMWPS
ncbi:hypothetical protein CWE08_06605 [Aliidiomarina iranensis]|uniref:Type II secretion system protein GspF domain-containing protein n=1 Tax=Aliidiomarina iranensis TaxID=1434071 RepID=A0A432VX58_9GAMM|nr:type II secretion system F family protein [Aliidiomarina iranensis]RUO21247.1 hypothetical protein CWE08_06605 [Aliidiomarina iranensis]